MLKEILKYEGLVFLYLNNLGHPDYDNFWLYLSNEYYWTPLYLTLLLITFYCFGTKKLLILLLILGVGLAISDSLSLFVKETVMRLRPCRNHEFDGKFRLVIESCRGYYGFYSAHASNHFFIASVLSFVFKKYKIVPFFLFSWAILIAYSRIYLGVHFPFDIITGSLVGLILAYFARKTLGYFFHHKYLS